jgi:hypothetical protein
MQILRDVSSDPTKSNDNSDLIGNVFVEWGTNGYLSEFTASGSCVQEARFLTTTFITYRIYKMEFIAAPKMEEIAVKAFSRGETKWGKLSITTTVYISWNGATEVNEWEIYKAENGEGDGSELWNSVGRVKKTGFETVFANTGYLAFVYARALDSKGKELGSSPVYLTIPPVWDCRHESCDELPSSSL